MDKDYKIILFSKYGVLLTAVNFVVCFGTMYREKIQFEHLFIIFGMFTPILFYDFLLKKIDKTQKIFIKKGYTVFAVFVFLLYTFLYIPSIFQALEEAY